MRSRYRQWRRVAVNQEPKAWGGRVVEGNSCEQGQGGPQGLARHTVGAPPSWTCASSQRSNASVEPMSSGPRPRAAAHVED